MKQKWNNYVYTPLNLQINSYLLQDSQMRIVNGSNQHRGNERLNNARKMRTATANGKKKMMMMMLL